MSRISSPSKGPRQPLGVRGLSQEGPVRKAPWITDGGGHSLDVSTGAEH
jgi:hypothetical protein